MSFGSFVWSIVKQLPLPLLMGLSISVGMAGLWLLSQLGGLWALLVVLIVVVALILAVCRIAKGEPKACSCKSRPNGGVLQTDGSVMPREQFDRENW